VRDLVEAHGGDVEVEGRCGGGTCFRTSWPLVTSPGAPEEASAPQLVPGDFGIATAASDERGVYECAGEPKATLLLAEDEPQLRHELATLLAREYRVLVADDGEAALHLARLHRPDLLVTDVAMPNMDGIELTRRFLAISSNRVAPVLLLTAYGEIRDRLAGFDAGAVDYIVKPFAASELRARVRSQLDVRSLALRLLDAERLASIGRLSAGLAHELRNPANGILNAMEPLRDALAPADLSPGTSAGQLLDVIESCSRQIALLARELLGFRRGADLVRAPVRLDALVRRARVSVWTAGSGVEIRERLAFDGAVSCAEPLMQQVLSHLLDNAIHAAGRGGWVEVRSTVEGHRLVVELRDSGPGVPDAIRDKIWEPFFTTKPPGAGTGLGLATAREIVARHGGTLEVRGAVPDTVFRMEIPLEAV
jgi:signal transduction histidine kinase